MFKLSVQATDETTTRLKAVGRIVQSSISPFDDPIAETIHEATYERRVLLDVEDVDFVDSSGVSWLLTCHKRFREAGGILVIHTCTPPVLNILRVLKMDQVLHIAADEQEALQLVEKAND